jgi:hypothetical protein
LKFKTVDVLFTIEELKIFCGFILKKTFGENKIVCINIINKIIIGIYEELNFSVFLKSTNCEREINNNKNKNIEYLKNRIETKTAVIESIKLHTFFL